MSLLVSYIKFTFVLAAVICVIVILYFNRCNLFLDCFDCVHGKRVKKKCICDGEWKQDHTGACTCDGRYCVKSNFGHFGPNCECICDEPNNKGRNCQYSEECNFRGFFLKDTKNCDCSTMYITSSRENQPCSVENPCCDSTSCLYGAKDSIEHDPEFDPSTIDDMKKNSRIEYYCKCFNSDVDNTRNCEIPPFEPTERCINQTPCYLWPNIESIQNTKSAWNHYKDVTPSPFKETFHTSDYCVNLYDIDNFCGVDYDSAASFPGFQFNSQDYSPGCYANPYKDTDSKTDFENRLKCGGSGPTPPVDPQTISPSRISDICAIDYTNEELRGYEHDANNKKKDWTYTKGQQTALIRTRAASMHMCCMDKKYHVLIHGMKDPIISSTTIKDPKPFTTCANSNYGGGDSYGIECEWDERNRADLNSVECHYWSGFDGHGFDPTNYRVKAPKYKPFNDMIMTSENASNEPIWSRITSCPTPTAEEITFNDMKSTSVEHPHCDEQAHCMRDETYFEGNCKIYRPSSSNCASINDVSVSFDADGCGVKDTTIFDTQRFNNCCTTYANFKKSPTSKTVLWYNPDEGDCNINGVVYPTSSPK